MSSLTCKNKLQMYVLTFIRDALIYQKDQKKKRKKEKEKEIRNKKKKGKRKKLRLWVEVSLFYIGENVA